MASKQDVFTLVGKRMRGTPSAPCNVDMPPIAELVRRIDRALRERRAA
ncbi:hypothetical protein [Sphingomonas sp. M1A8_2b]